MFKNIAPFNPETKKDIKKKEKQQAKQENKMEKEKEFKETTAASFSVNTQKNGSVILELKLKSFISKDNKNLNQFKQIKGDLEILKDIVSKLPPL